MNNISEILLNIIFRKYGSVSHALNMFVNKRKESVKILISSTFNINKVLISSLI